MICIAKSSKEKFPAIKRLREKAASLFRLNFGYMAFSDFFVFGC